jgi:hypothetical protein
VVQQGNNGRARSGVSSPGLHPFPGGVCVRDTNHHRVTVNGTRRTLFGPHPDCPIARARQAEVGH